METHESVKLYSQTAFNSLVCKFDKERDEKNEWKQKYEQLTNVLLKVTQYSQEVDPIVSSIDTEALKNVEQVGIKGQVVDEWIDRLKSKGSLLLDSMVKLSMDFEIVQSQMQGTKTTLTKEMEGIEKIIALWSKMEDFRIDVLVENKVITT